MVERTSTRTEASAARARRGRVFFALAALPSLVGCASSPAPEARVEASQPPARERASIVFPMISAEPGSPQAQWLASRNDDSLTPRPEALDRTTTAWPQPDRPNERPYLPVIWSRWGRSF